VVVESILQADRQKNGQQMLASDVKFITMLAKLVHLLCPQLHISGIKPANPRRLCAPVVKTP
jgi:hypothetical protein